MARVRENECKGCADCIHCGRNLRYHTYYECDSCGDEAKYRYDGKEYCESCLLEVLIADAGVEDVSEEDDY